MRHGSLFSGIGGFDLAAEWAGWENIFHCEWNKFGQKVLKHYWPKAISYDDITKTDFTIHRGTIDVLTGGFPCQPYSLAGKRKGKEDDRHLWPEMLRAIKEIQPRWVVGENVFGLVNWSGGMVFDEVQSDLEAAGHEVFPYVLPACGKNAPHRRERIWFVAYSNATGERWNERQKQIETNDVANSGLLGQAISEKQTTRIEQCNKGDVTNTNIDKRHEGWMHPAESETAERYVGTRNSWKNGNAWQNFPTQSPLCNGNDGLSSQLDGITFPKWRNESIKAGGNAIVPQVALEIFKAINEYELLTANVG